MASKMVLGIEDASFSMSVHRLNMLLGGSLVKPLIIFNLGLGVRSFFLN